MIVTLVISAGYFAKMESSDRQATLGKMAMGLKVIDLNGNRLTLGKAIIRFLFKIVSGAIFGIGYLMAAFTERRQALHDILGKTLVINAGDPALDVAFLKDLKDKMKS